MEASPATVTIQLIPEGDDIVHAWDMNCVCGPSPVLFQGNLAFEHHWLRKREE